MRGRVPGTGFPHVLGVCGEAPRLHERDQHHVGAPQPPGNGGSCKTRSGSSSQRPSRQMGRSEYSRQVLVEESLFRARSLSLYSRWSRPHEEWCRASKEYTSNRAAVWSQPDWSFHCMTLPYLLEPWFLHPYKTTCLAGLL